MVSGYATCWKHGLEIGRYIPSIPQDTARMYIHTQTRKNSSFEPLRQRDLASSEQANSVRRIAVAVGRQLPVAAPKHPALLPIMLTDQGVKPTERPGRRLAMFPTPVAGTFVSTLLECVHHRVFIVDTFPFRFQISEPVSETLISSQPVSVDIKNQRARKPIKQRRT